VTTPGYLFETTVLSAFAIAGRLSNLAARYRSRAGWVDVVHAEIMSGLSVVPALGDVLAATWLPPPIETFAVKEIEHIRQLLGGHAKRPAEHLGEAASIVYALRGGYTLATDDRDAKRVAESRGCRVITTVTILRACVRNGPLTLADANAMLVSLVQQGRRLPVSL
jgi:predicted nucleic acid-binding protein